MKQLTCEMCGGTDLLKQDGVFVCQGCGCKYSVEEARKLMMETDGTLNVRGTVQVDRSSEMHNRMQNAIAEYNAGHQDRAIALFNEVLNMDYENVTAILYKAAADGFLSSLADNRLGQTAMEMCRGIDIAAAKSENTLAFTEAIRPAIVELTRIAQTVTTMCEKRKREEESEIRSLKYSAESEEDEAKSCFWRGDMYEIDFHNDRASMYSNQASDRTIKLNKLLSQNVQATGTAITAVAEKIMSVMENADASYDGFSSDMKKLVDVAAVSMKRLSYSVRIGKLPERIAAMGSRIAEATAIRKANAIRLYWEQHTEQKLALEAEQKSLFARQGELQPEIDRIEAIIKDIEGRKFRPVPAEDEITELKARRSAAEEQLNKLGIFKAKERKPLKEEINRLSDQISGLWDTVHAQKAKLPEEIARDTAPHKEELKKWQDKIAPVNKRLEEISEEFSKDR